MIRRVSWVLVMAVVAMGVEPKRVASPSKEMFAHYTMCDMQNPCTPEVVLTRPDGTEVQRFQVRDNDGPCMSILGLDWAGEKALGVHCHGNPSMGTYFEVDAGSGKVLRTYVGYGFVRSPDYLHVAHVGWIIHFAPPWVQSAYLQIGTRVIIRCRRAKSHAN